MWNIYFGCATFEQYLSWPIWVRLESKLMEGHTYYCHCLPFSSPVDRTRLSNSEGDFGSSCNSQGGLKDSVTKRWIVWSFLLWSKFIICPEWICQFLADDFPCCWVMFFKTRGSRRWHFSQAGHYLKVKISWMQHQCIYLMCPTLMPFQLQNRKCCDVVPARL